MHMKYLLISDAARVAECVLAFDPRKEQRNGEQEEKLQPLFAILTKKQRFGAFFADHLPAVMALLGGHRVVGRGSAGRLKQMKAIGKVK